MQLLLTDWSSYKKLLGATEVDKLLLGLSKTKGLSDLDVRKLEHEAWERGDPWGRWHSSADLEGP